MSNDSTIEGIALRPFLGTIAGRITGIRASTSMLVDRYGHSLERSAMSAKHKKVMQWYVRVATASFSLWLIVVFFKVIVVAGHFVSQMIATITNNIPFIS